MRTLLPQHADLIVRSAISADVAGERIYYSETVKARLLELGFSARQARVPALVIGLHGTDGRVVGCQVRPDDPRLGKSGKPVKYETPRRARNRLDVHPRSQPALGNPNVPLLITEGIRKADAAVTVGLCVVAFTGVWNWRGTNEHGGLTALADWHDVALNGRRIYLAWDSDAWENPHVHAALADLREWLKTRDADVRILYLPALDSGAKCGLDDYLAAGHTRDDLLALASTELRPPPHRAPAAPAGAMWNGPTPKTADLLNAVRTFVGKYVVMRDAQRDAVALWVLHTHAFAAAGSTPYLAISSPEPESGKTLLLEVLEVIVARPWLTGRVTAAALVRKVDRDRPTLLLDESDAAFKSGVEYAEALRGLLNSGYRASGRATLCVGQGADITVRDFATFCPKAIAGLGKLPDTVRTRSIPLEMKRRTADETVSVWLSSSPPADAEELSAKLAAWAAAQTKALGTANPTRPHGLGDRAYDVWRPLLAIAEHADGDWTTSARASSTALSGKGQQAQTHGVALLGKLRALFADTDQLSTGTIVAEVNADDTLPFGGWRDGQGLDARTLGKLLRPYGVKPAQLWTGEANVRGYRRDDLADAFARYLAPLSARSARTQAQSQIPGVADPLEDAGSSGYEEAENGSGMRVLADLADTSAREQAHEDARGQLSMVNGRPASAIEPDLITGAEGSSA